MSYYTEVAVSIINSNNRNVCLLPDSAFPAKHSQFHAYIRIVNALGLLMHMDA